MQQFAETNPSPPAPPPKLGLASHAFATAVATLLLALVGFVLAYVMALVVVKIGLGGPRLFVGVPLVAVGALAWSTSQTARPTRVTVRLLEIAVAGGIAAAALLLAGPSHPARLLEHESTLTDVDLHGDQASLTFEQRTRLTVMPPTGQLLALTVILAGLAVAGSSLGRCFSKPPPEAA